MQIPKPSSPCFVSPPCIFNCENRSSTSIKTTPSPSQCLHHYTHLNSSPLSYLNRFYIHNVQGSKPAASQIRRMGRERPGDGSGVHRDIQQSEGREEGQRIGVVEVGVLSAIEQTQEAEPQAPLQEEMVVLGLKFSFFNRLLLD